MPVPAMSVGVGGSTYEISGIPYGTVPVWKLIKKDGQALTHSSFDALPGPDKIALAGHVKTYVDDLNRK